MTRREKIGGAVLCAILGADSDWQHEWPWRGALGGLIGWMFVLWLDADPERKEIAG